MYVHTILIIVYALFLFLFEDLILFFPFILIQKLGRHYEIKVFSFLFSLFASFMSLSDCRQIRITTYIPYMKKTEKSYRLYKVLILIENFL